MGINIEENKISYNIMTLPTQTMENTTEVAHISIYDRRKGRPKALANSLMKKDEREPD